MPYGNVIHYDRIIIHKPKNLSLLTLRFQNKSLTNYICSRVGSLIFKNSMHVRCDKPTDRKLKLNFNCHFVFYRLIPVILTNSTEFELYTTQINSRRIFGCHNPNANITCYKITKV